MHLRAVLALAGSVPWGQSLVEDLRGPICPTKPPHHRLNYMACFSLNLEFPSLFVEGFFIGLMVLFEYIFSRLQNPVNTYLCSSEKSKNKSQVSVFSLYKYPRLL